MVVLLAVQIDVHLDPRLIDGLQKIDTTGPGAHLQKLLRANQ